MNLFYTTFSLIKKKKKQYSSNKLCVYRPKIFQHTIISCTKVIFCICCHCGINSINTIFKINIVFFLVFILLHVKDKIATFIQDPPILFNITNNNTIGEINHMISYDQTLFFLLNLLDNYTI